MPNITDLKPPTPLIQRFKAEPGMKDVGGSEFMTVNSGRLSQAISATSSRGKSRDEVHSSQEATILALAGIDPRDDIEGMLAVQLLAVHNACMECFRRAMVDDIPFDYRERNLKLANKFARTFTMQMEAIQRYRGKVQQKVVVEHVTVNAGGQAIVGAVSRGEG